VRMNMRPSSLAHYLIVMPLALLLLPLDSAQAVLPGGPTPGLYVQVLDGSISINNLRSAQMFSTGQFGIAPNFASPPIVLPTNPSILFNPPPSFSSPTTKATGVSSPATNVSIDQIDAMLSAKPASAPAKPASAPTPSSSSSVVVLGRSPTACTTYTTASGLLGTTTTTACGLPPTKK